MRFKLYIILVCATLSFVGCGSSDSGGATSSGNTTSVYGSLNISVPTNSNVFAANIGETVTNTYTFSAVSQNSSLTSASSSNTYSVNVNGLGAAMSVASNSCQNVPSGSQCAIAIQFSPTSINHYAQNTQLSFSSNVASINAQTLNVTTAPSTLDVTTTNYDTNKTSLMMSIGNANPAQAEIDTGSQVTVVDFNVTNQADYKSGDINVSSAYAACYNAILALAKNNGLKTDANLSASPYNCAVIAYDYGNRPVYGFPANGSVSITATNGMAIKTNPNTPLFISNNINNQNSASSTNSIIMGVGMNNQVSAKNYMPYPYNVMMMIDRSNNKITFGNFNAQTLSQFGFVQLGAMSQSNCINLGFVNLQPTDTNASCWNTQTVPVVFNQSDSNASGSMPSLLDSGANNGTIQYSVPPSWLNYNKQTGASSINGAYLPTSKGNIAIQLPLQLYVVSSQASKVNVGNIVFQYNKVLYNQPNGMLGLLPNN